MRFCAVQKRHPEHCRCVCLRARNSNGTAQGTKLSATYICQSDVRTVSGAQQDRRKPWRIRLLGSAPGGCGVSRSARELCRSASQRRSSHEARDSVAAVAACAATEFRSWPARASNPSREGVISAQVADGGDRPNASIGLDQYVSNWNSTVALRIVDASTGVDSGAQAARRITRYSRGHVRGCALGR